MHHDDRATGLHVGATRGEPVALIVEDDIDQRELIGTIVEESGVRVIECESGEAAMMVMEEIGERTIFLLSEVRLAGAMDGVDLACAVGSRWPHTRLVTISDDGAARPRALPPGSRHLTKPWRALDVIIELERAIDARNAS